MAGGAGILRVQLRAQITGLGKVQALIYGLCNDGRHVTKLQMQLMIEVGHNQLFRLLDYACSMAVFTGRFNGKIIIGGFGTGSNCCMTGDALRYQLQMQLVRKGGCKNRKGHIQQ